jgi:hypothetical protein
VKRTRSGDGSPQKLVVSVKQDGRWTLVAGQAFRLTTRYHAPWEISFAAQQLRGAAARACIVTLRRRGLALPTRTVGGRKIGRLVAKYRCRNCSSQKALAEPMREVTTRAIAVSLGSEAMAPFSARVRGYEPSKQYVRAQGYFHHQTTEVGASLICDASKIH